MAPLSDQAKQIIQEETDLLASVVTSLHSQREHKLMRLGIENQRARELTAEIVRTHRDDERWLLASDEAVSHGLKDKQKVDVEVIDRLLKQPYFARMVLNEEINGKERQIEYKIGLAENAECRIIDWRKAPIARLYYEYKEGDDYCEEIQGRERSGQITLRNMLETTNAQLSRIQCRHGSFVLKGKEWHQSSNNFHPHQAARNIPETADNTAIQNQDEESTAAGRIQFVPSEESASQNLLPQIASLLSAEQFTLISENLDKAMLIQGIAGSGKTTVALHRLAWLFADSSKAPAPEKCLILVLSHSLKTYISKTLPSLGVEGVRVLSLTEWLEEMLVRVLPHTSFQNEIDPKPRIRRPSSPTPSGIERLKRSMAMLKSVEDFVQKRLQNRHQFESITPDSILISVLKNPRAIMEFDETKLLNENLIREALDRATQNASNKALDHCDDALVLRISSMLNNGVFLKDGSFGKYEHIFCDEVQDFSPVDFACVLGAVQGMNAITMVGDTAQKIDAGSTFPGWDKLRKYWSFKESLSKFVSLDLSYRSTIEILKLADYIQQNTNSNRSEGRHGRIPIWFKCLSESRGIKATCDWLARAIEKYPSSITAVVCRNAVQAKHVLSLLRPSFGPAVRLGDEDAFSFEGGIIVTHAAQVRGLEFTNLLIWNPSKTDYPSDSNHRNLMYLAVSRARENVSIVTWGRQSDILPPIHSALIRGFDIAREEIEEQEREAKHAKQTD